MASPADHLGYADRNERFAEFLDSENSYYEWAIVGLFYSAVQIVKAYIIKTRGSGFGNHRNRNTFVANDPILSSISSKYGHLFQSSIAARYRSRRFNAQQFQDHRDLLDDIDSHVRPHV